MKRTGFWKYSTALAVAASQLLALSVVATGQGKGFVLTPVVKRGDSPSDGGRFFGCGECVGSLQGLHAFNNRGDVAISADVVGGTCFTNIFLISEGQSIRLADFCQTTEFGKFNLLGFANVNDLGEAVLETGVTTNNRLESMLLLYSQGRFTKVVKEGERSPIGTIFKGCGFGEPAINNKGEVAFHTCTETPDGFFFGDGVYLYSNGELRKVVIGTDPSPIGGQFALNFFPGQPVQINDNGQILFRAGVIFDPFLPERFGLFLSSNGVFEKIEIDGDRLPGGHIIKDGSFGIGDLNNKGEVAFVVGLDGQSDGGIFLYSNDSISKVVVAGDATPLGGRFTPFDQGPRVAFPLPHLNDNSSVAFRASVTDGRAPSGIFLASPNAILKVVAVGDKLPAGGRVRDITSFALNDFSQVAFYAEADNGPKGIYLATPLPPLVKKVKLKVRSTGPELIIKGSGFITNDSLIEINGVALSEMSYPESFRQNGGTTTRVVSRDFRLDELVPAGGSVEVKVFNALTNLRSAPVTFSR